MQTAARVPAVAVASELADVDASADDEAEEDAEEDAEDDDDAVDEVDEVPQPDNARPRAATVTGANRVVVSSLDTGFPLIGVFSSVGLRGA